MKNNWFALLAVLGLAGCATTVQPTSVPVQPPDASKLVKMKVVGVTSGLEADSYVMLLESVEGKDSSTRLPIFVGEREATVLNMKLARQSTPRPLTHDLSISLLTAAGGEIRQIVIEDLQEGIFLARIYLADGKGRLRSVDSRASDAIILGVATGKDIHADRKVLQKAGIRSEKSTGPALDI
jgi:hypothetical protein